MVANQFTPVMPPYFIPSVALMVLVVAFLIWLKRPRLHLSYRLTGAILTLILMAATKPLLLSTDVYGAHRVRGFNEWVEVEDAKAHGIKDSGDALKALLARLNEDEAPTLFIAFGDHNPALGQETDGAYKDLDIDVGAGELSGYLNRCRTPYILWANRALKEKMQKPFVGEGPDLSPQYLMNYTFRYLGWTGPKYMHIMEEKLPEVTVVNDQVIKNEGRYLFSKDEEFDAVQQFVKSLDYYNNKHFYYFEQ